MVGHQTPRQDIGMRQDMLLYFLQEEQIILLGKEDGDPVIPLVVDVVYITLFEYHTIGVFWFFLVLVALLVSAYKVFNLAPSALQHSLAPTALLTDDLLAHEVGVRL